MIVPFKKTSVYAGFGSTSGLVKFEKRTLEIEYQTIDEIFKYFKSEARQVTFQLSDIESVDIKKGWFSYKFFIDLKSLKALDRFPAVNGNQIKLRVSRSNREKLKNLKSTLALALSEHKLQQFDDDLDETELLNKNDHLEIDKKQRSEKTDRKNHGDLPNALER